MSSTPDPEVEQELQRLKTEMGLTKIPAPVPMTNSAASKATTASGTPTKSAAPKRGIGIPWELQVFCVVGGLVIALIWGANLPFPFIRQPVEEHAPVLLVPSYMSWDYNYRQAIPLVEQSEQLINQPTTFADLEQGTRILKQAKQHVDALPVSFYRSSAPRWYWHQFSSDQFRQMRESVGRMEAKLFQERQSQVLLMNTESALKMAQAGYQQAQSEPERQAALDLWANVLNQLQQISTDTLAGQLARTKLELYTQEYRRVSTSVTP